VEQALVPSHSGRFAGRLLDLCGERKGDEHQADEENALVRDSPNPTPSLLNSFFALTP
jgi:hypothetical protein